MAEINTKLLAALICEKKRADNLTLDDIARSVGISTSGVSRVTNAIGTLDIDALDRVCRWLGITISWLTVRAGAEVLRREIDDGQSTLQVIHGLILNDGTLSPDAQSALFRIMEIGYTLGKSLCLSEVREQL